MSRHWDETSMEGLTAAFAGVSTFRVPDEGSKDEQAAWITEQAALALSGYSDDSKFNPTWNPLSRQNTAIMLGNSMPDVDAAARESDASQPSSTFEKNFPKVWSSVRRQEVRALLQELGTDDTALASLGEAAARFCAERTKADSRIEYYTSNPAESAVTQIANDCEFNNKTIGFLLGAAQKGRELNDKDKDAGIGLLFSALSDGLKFVPSPQSAAVGSAISIAQSHALSHVRSALTSKTPKNTVEDYGDAWQAQNEANAINALAEAGLVPDDAYIAANGKPYVYHWLKEDGTIDVDMFTLKPGGSNEDFSQYRNELNKLSTDVDFTAWSSRDTSRESAYKLGVDEGRK